MLSRLFYPKTTTSYEKFYVTINPAVTTENCCFLSIFLITKESKNELGDSTGLFRNLSNSRHAAENAHATPDVRRSGRLNPAHPSFLNPLSSLVQVFLATISSILFLIFRLPAQTTGALLKVVLFGISKLKSPLIVSFFFFPPSQFFASTTNRYSTPLLDVN
jgi:hypothetical protein